MPKTGANEEVCRSPVKATRAVSDSSCLPEGEGANFQAVAAQLPQSDGDRHPGPWAFHAYRWGFPNVIVDGAGGYIVSSVPVSCGALLAAGPSLLATLERITAAAAPGSTVHERSPRAR